MQYEVTAISQRVYKHGLDSNLSDSVFINYTQFTLSAVFVEEKNKRKSSLSPLCKTDPTKFFFKYFESKSDSSLLYVTTCTCILKVPWIWMKWGTCHLHFF